MIHSINFLQIAAGALEGISKSDLLIMKVLPFLGISVVVGGLSILALVLTQFKRLAEDKGHQDVTTPVEKKKSEETNVEKVMPNASDDTSELELHAAAIALSLYIIENSDRVYLTEVDQCYNQTPWTSMSIFKQANRFKKWQSLKK